MPNVVWEPLKGSQELALDSRADYTLYDGTRGPGKTTTQLMRFRRRVGLGYSEYWRGIIFDKEFKDLSDIVAQSQKHFKKFDDGAKFLRSAQDYKWIWPTGEQLLFRHAKDIKDYDTFHGHEYPFIGWTELTKQPNAALHDKLMSCNRSSFIPELHTPKGNKGEYLTIDGKPLPDIPLEVFSTTNSTGPGRNWVKLRFIDCAQPGQVIRRTIKVFNPRTQEDEEQTISQVRIFGSYRENIYLDPKYIAKLNELKDEKLKRAWLYGDWNVVTGGAFDDVWDDNVHKLPRFKVPRNWYVDRSFDWGSTHPFSVGWWAEANGEEIQLEDNTWFCPRPGSLIQVSEWYGTEEIGTNKGLKMSAGDIAVGIREREIAMMQAGWVSKQPLPGPADNQIRDVREIDVDTIEKKMEDEGICWTRSDKSPGSRINGMQLARDMYHNAKVKEGPGLYHTINCKASISIVPGLPRDVDKQDDVDTDAEDHPWDMERYRVLAGSNRIATNLNIRFA